MAMVAGNFGRIYLDGEFIGETQSVEAQVKNDVELMIEYELMKPYIEAEFSKRFQPKRDYTHDMKVSLKMKNISDTLRNATEHLVGKPYEPSEMEKIINERVKQLTRDMEKELSHISIEGSFDPND